MRAHLEYTGEEGKGRGQYVRDLHTSEQCEHSAVVEIFGSVCSYILLVFKTSDVVNGK